MCTCVCFAVGPVLTIRKQLHHALHGWDHVLTRNHLQSPSKIRHFLHQCEYEWKRTQWVGVRGLLCQQKALSDEVGYVFHTSACVFSLLLSKLRCTGGGWVLFTSVSSDWDQCWNMSADQRRKVGALWLPLSSGSFDPGQPHDRVMFSGAGDICNSSPESFACSSIRQRASGSQDCFLLESAGNS